MASDIARDIGNCYYDILSSLTRWGLKAIQKIISEAVMLKDIVKKHIADC
jgi:hypothetical protein